MTDILTLASSGIYSCIPRRIVKYQRDTDYVNLNAIKGRSTFEYEDDERHVHKAQVIDFIIDQTILILDGVLVEPAGGDLITDRNDVDGSVRVYEVVSRYGEPCWRFTDQMRSLYRIHVQLVTET